ncbi:hypothetical protein NSQ89_25100 [Niallia sp. FSL R7-0648]|uniref:hypothetical protein n=1 Tax=unclassified Niallia TaxID=2837522 RepID=UPI0011A60CDA
MDLWRALGLWGFFLFQLLLELGYASYFSSLFYFLAFICALNASFFFPTLFFGFHQRYEHHLSLSCSPFWLSSTL